jgi:methylated-DNA-protein-cysteine methyltransferase-like protein
MRDSPPFNQQAFYAQVWNLVRQVPRGKVVTYGQIAQMLPAPAEMDLQTYQALSPRWAVSARPGAQRQRLLLEQEGIVFVKDKVDLRVYQWRGPGG